MIVAGVEVTHDMIEALIVLGWIPEERSEDRREVGAAIARVLADVARDMRKKGDTRLHTTR